MTIREAKSELRKVGVTLNKKSTGEFRVNLAGGSEATAYYSDDLEDAFQTGLYMSNTIAICPKCGRQFNEAGCYTEE